MRKKIGLFFCLFLFMGTFFHEKWAISGCNTEEEQIGCNFLFAHSCISANFIEQFCHWEYAFCVFEEVGQGEYDNLLNLCDRMYLSLDISTWALSAGGCFSCELIPFCPNYSPVTECINNENPQPRELPAPPPMNQGNELDA